MLCIHTTAPRQRKWPTSEEAFIDRCATFTRGRLTCPYMYYQTALISEQLLLIQSPLTGVDGSSSGLLGTLSNSTGALSNGEESLREFCGGGETAGHHNLHRPSPDRCQNRTRHCVLTVATGQNGDRWRRRHPRASSLLSRYRAANLPRKIVRGAEPAAQGDQGQK